jgi:hypothetical protein
VTAFDFAHSDHQKVRLEPADFWLTQGYFSELLTEVNTLFRLEPRPLTFPMKINRENISSNRDFSRHNREGLGDET